TIPKIGAHEAITGQTMVNAVTYKGFVDILKSGDAARTQEELTTITANFSTDAFDHYFNPLNLLQRLVDTGMERKAARDLLKTYEKEVFKPVRAALANKAELPGALTGEAPPGTVPQQELFPAAAEAAAPPKVSQEGAWWKVEGTDNRFSTQEQAQRAADNIAKYGAKAEEGYSLGAYAPIFYSKMAKELADKLPGKGDPKSVWQLIKGWA